jgi:O-antigen ligase
MTIAQSAATAAHNEPPGSSAKPEEPRERTPWLLAFLCLLIPALPSYLVLGPLKSNGSPARVIAMIFFILAILGFIVIRRTAATRTMRPGIALILLYFLLQLAIFGVGLTHLGSSIVEASKTRWLIIMVAYTGVALYAMTRVETERQFTIVLGCLAIGLTFMCVVGLLQETTAIDLRYLFQPPGFVVNTDSVGEGERFGSTRIPATSAHPIEFSVLAAVTVPLTMHFARYAAGRQVRWFATLACVVALLAVPLALSRTGVIALGAALLVYLWSFKVRELVVGIIGATAWVAGYIAVFPATANALWETIVNSEHDDSVLGRTEDYAVVSKMFRANPLFGIGLGANPPAEYRFLDNEWLQAMVQGGTVGIAAMTALAAGGIFGISAALRAATTPRERDRAYMLGAAFVAILTSSFTFDLFSFQQASLIFFILFGLLWANYKVLVPEARTARLESFGLP